MSDVAIWHNPRCTKSRETLALLTERGITPKVRLYLEAPPSRDELIAVLHALDLPASALVRWKEPELPAGLTKASDDAAILDALVAHPRLIERPVVIHHGKARIGRPPAQVLEIL